MIHALITGAGSGIGAAITRTLAGQGYAVSLLGRREAPLQATSGQLPEGARSHIATCDVTDSDSVARAFDSARAALGDIDVLVNCAGAAPTTPFHKLDSAGWRAVMAVNLDGVFNCCAQVVPAMRERGAGRIVNIASTASLKGYAYVSAYCAAKHGVLGLTRALALELARKGVTVNAVCPGYTDTDIIRDAVANIVQKTGRSEEQALEEFTRVNPQGRLIDPQEVADTVTWLCSEGARSVTGQAISISGGETS
ncbi:SDR family NAD(P)-dependent oxidoreductase [Parahaliea mediterranea]|uniref:SDR family oxidoreductase n=1 Tax=Parahaliea mediterranea TaxID=651086 RepID=A0A939DFS9_9GAMM|nr:SDR family NAD(P)-dependent oxidoreductase [Parahaliea mediterranea]MBN7797374.1 SDR family oxidoreductase [Parahaliea mediterranea]